MAGLGKVFFLRGPVQRRKKNTVLSTKENTTTEKEVAIDIEISEEEEHSTENLSDKILKDLEQL